jgi:hypothetical protein
LRHARHRRVRLLAWWERAGVGKALRGKRKGAEREKGRVAAGVWRVVERGEI